MEKNRMYWYCDQRKNVHVKGGKEWALNIKFNTSSYWNITTFAYKPKQKEIDKLLEIIKRSCEVYHNLVVMNVVSFNLKIEGT